MLRTLTSALFLSAFAISASAHGPDEEKSSAPVIFDCGAMTGKFNVAKLVVTISVADGKVTFTPAGKPAVVGDCVAPLIAGGNYYPRAFAKFDKSFGAKFNNAEYYTIYLKGDALIIDKTNDTWKRRTP